MRRAKLILAIVFLLTLCSGVVAGMLYSRLPVNSSTGVQPSPTQLQLALHLTQDQEDKMEKIWEGVRKNVDDCVNKAHDIQHRQDEALSALLTEDQKAKFKKIQGEFRQQSEDLKAAEEQAIHQAVQQTDLILDDQQRKHYHEIVDKRIGHAGESPWFSPDVPTTRGS
jgi:hypothetical protein